MRRALLKAAALAVAGRAPRGPALYRRLTRVHLGTQAGHVDKLRRVWPDCVEVWRARCGVDLEGARLWIHEGGWTPYPTFAAYLSTGRGGVVTNAEARVQDRYLTRAINGALATPLPADDARRARVDALRWSAHAAEAIAALGGELYEGVDVAALPLEDASVDLCHSGGALEHLPPDRLHAFLRECHRVLRPGAVASHVFDHRDHLRHADPSWPFHAHWALPDRLYDLAFGHPLTYHNRLTPTEVDAAFRSAGFERIAVRRRVLPSARYVDGDDVGDALPGLDRRFLAPRFRDVSDADLRTAAAHYLYRRPA